MGWFVTETMVHSLLGLLHSFCHIAVLNAVQMPRQGLKMRLLPGLQNTSENMLMQCGKLMEV